MPEHLSARCGSFLWEPQRQCASMRVAYNRIPKASSSFMIAILSASSKKNGFRLENHANYFPEQAVLAHELHVLRDNTVYVNHASFVSSERNLTWINVIRDPIERWESNFYYEVDPALRRVHAIRELERREQDTECGCARLEFDECINVLYHRNCSMDVPAQIPYFCELGENCTRERATARARERYLLVGLTEELDLTVKLLEKLLPQFFAGAASLSSVPHRATTLTNSFTNTTMNGAISHRARAQIAQKAHNYKDERLFYEDIKRLFLHQACQMGVL